MGVDLDISRWQGIGPPPPAGGQGPPCSQCAWSTWVELGGGDSPQAYHPNVDLRDIPTVDIVHDLERGTLPFHDCHAQRVKGIHFIEHISRDAARSVLRECCRVLQPGGSLFLLVSDFEFVVDRLAQDGVCEAWLNCVYHGPNDGDRMGFHKWAYTFATLTEELEAAGFINVTHRGWFNRWEFYVEAWKPEGGQNLCL